MWQNIKTFIGNSFKQEEWRKEAWQIQAVHKQFERMEDKPKGSAIELVAALYEWLLVEGIHFGRKVPACDLTIRSSETGNGLLHTYHEHHQMTYRIGAYEIDFRFTLTREPARKGIRFTTKDIRDFTIRTVNGKETLVAPFAGIDCPMVCLFDVPHHVQREIRALAQGIQAKSEEGWNVITLEKKSEQAAKEERRKQHLAQLK